MGKKHFTKTVTKDGRITPWLLVSRELAYTLSNDEAAKILFCLTNLFYNVIPGSPQLLHRNPALSGQAFSPAQIPAATAYLISFTVIPGHICRILPWLNMRRPRDILPLASVRYS